MRTALLIVLLLTLAFGVALYSQRAPAADLVWGRKGAAAGDFVRPRAAVIINDELTLVDFTARIQRYSLDGVHTGLTFTTPDYRNGRPSGLGVDRHGRLMVCDSHYHCVRIYEDGDREVKCLTGDFGYVSDCVQAANGDYYISEFGQHDRITRLNQSGEVVHRWGKTGNADGEFLRVRALAIGPDGNLYAADACNHRIQVFNLNGDWLKNIGEPGHGPGQLHYPYDLSFGPDGDLYVLERGNCRVQRFDSAGQSRGVWGSPGREPGQLADPWALAVDKQGRVHVIDTENHRVQRVKF